MHMADALVSPPVAAVAATAAAALIAVATHKVKEIKRDDIVPLMGVMGAFVFAAQMINFSIPGTGSSGHVIGGILLAAVVGPWAAFLTLCSVIMIQCLVFADGGLLALGCNILNMAATSCLIGYPLVYRPIVRDSRKAWRLMTGAIAASVVALEIGALGVTAETELSGITALPAGVFLSFMLPIHLAIGAIEGIATGTVICFLDKYRPETLYSNSKENNHQPYTANRSRTRNVLIVFAVAALLLAGCFTWLASADPDGLEWSVGKVGGMMELSSATIPTAIMPDYDSSFAGIVGATLVMLLLWAFTSLIFRRMQKSCARIGHKK